MPRDSPWAPMSAQPTGQIFWTGNSPTTHQLSQAQPSREGRAESGSPLCTAPILFAKWLKPTDVPASDTLWPVRILVLKFGCAICLSGSTPFCADLGHGRTIGTRTWRHRQAAAESPVCGSDLVQSRIRALWGIHARHVARGQMSPTCGGTRALHTAEESAKPPANWAPTMASASGTTDWPTGVPNTLMPSTFQTCSPKSSTFGGDTRACSTPCLPCVQPDSSDLPQVLYQQIVHFSSVIWTSDSVHIVQKCEQDFSFSKLCLQRRQCVVNRQTEQKGHQWIPLFYALCLVNVVRDTSSILPPVARSIGANGPDERHQPRKPGTLCNLLTIALPWSCALMPSFERMWRLGLCQSSL